MTISDNGTDWLKVAFLPLVIVLLASIVISGYLATERQKQERKPPAIIL